MSVVYFQSHESIVFEKLYPIYHYSLRQVCAKLVSEKERIFLLAILEMPPPAFQGP